MDRPDANLLAPEIHDFTECAVLLRTVAGSLSVLTKLGFAVLAIGMARMVARRHGLHPAAPDVG